jgi:pimeloyl-ACP methyl ester carboxylesterase
MQCVINGLAVHHLCIGDGIPVLMIPGFQVDHRLMAGCMEPVFQEVPGFRRVYLDLPGMGQTKRADWIRDADAMLELLLAFIENVMPGERLLVAGESYGGYLARGLYKKLGSRVAGLLLLCPVIHPALEDRTLPERQALATDTSFLARLAPEEAKSAKESLVVQTEPVWRRFRDEVLAGIAVADKPFLKAYRENGYALSFDVDRLEAPCPCPTLFVMGRQDDAVGYRDAWPILENYPRATFAVLDRAGHSLQIEQAELFNALVREWLMRSAEMWKPKG